MDTELVHIGFGNVLAINRVVAIVSPNSAPTKRLIQESKSAGRVIDMTSGRRTKAVLVMDTSNIVLVAIRARHHRASREQRAQHPSSRRRPVVRRR